MPYNYKHTRYKHGPNSNLSIIFLYKSETRVRIHMLHGRSAKSRCVSSLTLQLSIYYLGYTYGMVAMHATLTVNPSQFCHFCK